MTLTRQTRIAGARRPTGRGSRLAAALAVAWLAPAVHATLPDPATINDAFAARQALDQVRRERAEVDGRRREALADCARRFMANRCADQVEREHRAARTGLRAVERRADEVIREDRNLGRNRDLAQRERDAELRARSAQQAEAEHLSQRRAREEALVEQEADRLARQAQDEQARAQYEARQKARAQRLGATPPASAAPGGDVAPVRR